MELKLANGRTIPSPGFGTFKTPDGEICINAVREAIAAGYRHIDTAAVYGNERSVGEGIRQGGVPRKDLFVTSKVWNTDRGYDKTLRACEKSLQDLGMDYLDLYLIHWPANRLQFEDQADALNLDTWRALERLVDEKVIRSAGLSNFYPQHMAAILSAANVAPVVDQVEYHPGLLQEETVALCHSHGILVEAWSPLGRGKLLEEPVLVSIAASHGKSPAQVLVRWCMQRGILPLVKSIHAERIRENLDVFDLTLTPAEIDALAALPSVRVGSHPDLVTW